MTIQLLIDFFKWCTIINGCLLLYWTGMCAFFPDMVYRLQSRWFPMPREKYNMLMYTFLGLFKVVFIVFNLVPFLVLLAIT